MISRPLGLLDPLQHTRCIGRIHRKPVECRAQRLHPGTPSSRRRERRRRRTRTPAPRTRTRRPPGVGGKGAATHAASSPSPRTASAGGKKHRNQRNTRFPPSARIKGRGRSVQGKERTKTSASRNQDQRVRGFLICRRLREGTEGGGGVWEGDQSPEEGVGIKCSDLQGRKYYQAASEGRLAGFL